MAALSAANNSLTIAISSETGVFVISWCTGNALPATLTTDFNDQGVAIKQAISLKSGQPGKDEKNEKRR